MDRGGIVVRVWMGFVGGPMTDMGLAVVKWHDAEPRHELIEINELDDGQVEIELAPGA